MHTSGFVALALLVLIIVVAAAALTAGGGRRDIAHEAVAPFTLRR
jgi:hypothetical protein